MKKSVEIFPVPPQFAAKAHVDQSRYEALYRESVSDPEGFWSRQARELLLWQKPWSTILNWDFKAPSIRWFEGGKINISENCLDRHLETRGDKPAIVWEGNEPGETRTLTYRELHAQVCNTAALDRKSTRLNSSHTDISRMPSSA